MKKFFPVILIGILVIVFTFLSIGRLDASQPVFKDYQDLSNFSEEHGFFVTSKNNGQHNKKSLHGKGLAIDVRTWDHTPEEVEGFMEKAKAAGLRVLDERCRPKKQKVWGGSHVHIEISSLASTNQKGKCKASKPTLEAKLSTIKEKYGTCREQFNQCYQSRCAQLPEYSKEWFKCFNSCSNKENRCLHSKKSTTAKETVPPVTPVTEPTNNTNTITPTNNTSEGPVTYTVTLNFSADGKTSFHETIYSGGTVTQKPLGDASDHADVSLTETFTWNESSYQGNNGPINGTYSYSCTNNRSDLSDPAMRQSAIVGATFKSSAGIYKKTEGLHVSIGSGSTITFPSDYYQKSFCGFGYPNSLIDAVVSDIFGTTWGNTDRLTSASQKINPDGEVITLQRTMLKANSYDAVTYTGTLTVNKIK